MTYLLLGDDPLAKDQDIARLKTKVLKSPESSKFDYEVLHAHKLTPETLKKALISLPAVAAQRFIVLREAHRLSPQNKDLLLQWIKEKSKHAVLVLDSDQWDPKDTFVKKLGRNVKTIGSAQGPQFNAFDLAKAISFRKKMEALKILSNLLNEGTHPLQIMGALVWSWGNRRQQVSSDQFHRGLLALQEADLNIKRSRLRADYVMEVLVVKLCCL